MFALLFAPGNQPPEKGQPFRLEAGDFRWVPFTIRQTPVEVECHFEVTRGGPSVHLELLPMTEFRLFDRGEEHSTLAATPDGLTGDFRRTVDVSGQYAVVVVNSGHALPATVSLQVRTSMNPDGRGSAQTLSPGRRLTVILLSFTFFFATLAWSGLKLIRAMRTS